MWWPWGLLKINEPPVETLEGRFKNESYLEFTQRLYSKGFGFTFIRKSWDYAVETEKYNKQEMERCVKLSAPTAIEEVKKSCCAIRYFTPGIK